MNREKAFTLTEVIIVLVILGALALILVPNMSRMMPDDHNIRYKKAFYTIQEIVNDIVNDPSVCQGMFWNSGTSSWENANIATGQSANLRFCYKEDGTGRNLAQEICNRLSTTAECSTANIANINIANNNGSTGILTTNGMRWNLAPGSGGTTMGMGMTTNSGPVSDRTYTIYVDIDGCGSNNNFNDDCVGTNPNANDGVYRITIRTDGKVFPGTATAGEDEDNLLLNDPTN